MDPKLITLLGSLALAACAAQHPRAVSVPDTLKPGAGETRRAVFAARGWQIYECRRAKTDAGRAEWAFVAPEADLYDGNGHRAGKHFAGPQWESLDGSRIAGTVRASVESPEPSAIPWVLLTATSVGPDGLFAKVTSVQRVNTVGGRAPPATDCTMASIGTQRHSAYTADYVMFGGK